MRQRFFAFVRMKSTPSLRFPDRRGIAFVKWIGAHKDYDKIDVKEVQHGG